MVCKVFSCLVFLPECPNKPTCRIYHKRIVQVSEFVGYRRSVQNSFHAVLTRTEHVLMDIFTQGNM